MTLRSGLLAAVLLATSSLPLTAAGSGSAGLGPHVGQRGGLPGEIIVDPVTKFEASTTVLHPPFFANAAIYDGQFTGVCIGDYNRDGLEDLYFTNNGNPVTIPGFLAGWFDGKATNLVNPKGKGMPNALYENRSSPGGLHFVDVTATTGVEDAIGIGGGCVFADFDNDGDLDLYVANHLRGVTFSEFGFHSVEQGYEVNGFRDPPPFGFPKQFQWDSEEGQLNGEFVVLTDPATGKPRGEGRNTLYKNLLTETGTARFVDVTDEAGDVGGTRTGMPGGRYSTTVAVADVNGDGLVDLYVGNFVDQDFWNTKGRVNVKGERGGAEGSHLKTNAETNRLYVNRGGLQFDDLTDEAGVGAGVTHFYDYDGSRHEPYEPELRDIEGNPVGERGTLSWSVAFNDFDSDGDPDIWVANDSPATINLFRNDTEPGGRPRFTDISRDSGVQMVGEWMSFAFGDIDHDGDLDVFCGNFGGTIYTYTHNTNPAMRVLADDVGEWNRWQNNASQHGLFRNDGVRVVRRDGVEQTIGTFPNIAPTVHLQQSAWMPMVTSDPTNVSPQKQPLFGLSPLEFIWGAMLFDYDNDTHIDLYAVGSLGKTMENPGRLIQNLGDYRFRDISVEAHALDIIEVNYERVDQGLPPLPEDNLNWNLHTQQNEDGGAVAWGDFDRDGFLDMVVNNSGGYNSALKGVPTYPGSEVKAFRPGPAVLFHNQGNENHWLALRLTGAPERSAGGGRSSRDAIGARVVATVDTENGPLTLVRELEAGSGFQAQHSMGVHLGLGEATSVRRLEVRWPWSSGTTVLHNVAADQLIEVHQDRAPVYARRPAGGAEPAVGSLGGGTGE